MSIYAGCYSDCCNTHRVNNADALVEAEVINLSTFLCEKTKIVHTVATLKILDRLTEHKPVPDELSITFQGGKFNGKTSFDSRSLKLKQKEQYFFYLVQNEDGEWGSYQAHADKKKKQKARAQKKFYKEVASKKKEPITSVTEDRFEAITAGVSKSRVTTYGFSEINGSPVRLTLADASQVLQVHVDSEFLPSGITQSEALTAVRNALDAWENASSLQFVITQNYNFGTAASAMDGESNVIHIQLHDTHDDIASSTTLGVGGGSLSPASGGTVSGTNFNTALSRYVVMNDDAPSNTDLSRFEQVLTHEVGHALGLSHSSEDSNESDSDLADATMFFRLQNDGRGASLMPYDTNQMVIGYPVNTPPVGSHHFIRAISRSSSQPTPLANVVQLNGFDINDDTLTYNLVSQSSTNGTFSFNTSTGVVSYKSNAAFSGSDLTANNSNSGTNYYDILEYSISDGVHTSPTYSVRIVAYVPDFNTSSELPSSWVSTHFGGSTPLHTADADGDGANNLLEFIRGTDPNDASDGSVSLNFDITGNSLTLPTLLHADKAILESSNDLENWNTATSFFQSEPDVPENATIYLPNSSSDSKLFYRAIIAR